MSQKAMAALEKLGFSAYEARAYLALLRENPATGYQLAKLSGVPRSMIYEALGKLVARGAAMTLRKGETTQYAPVPPEEFLDQLHREHEELTDALRTIWRAWPRRWISNTSGISRGTRASSPRRRR